MSEALQVEHLDTHQTLQYQTPQHQADTALAGMWLFLATEVLFFGALFLGFLWVHHSHPAGYALGAKHADLLIGSVNTVVLVSSSLVFTLGLAAHRAGHTRMLLQCCAVTAGLGLAFLALKGIEWTDDFHQRLFPGANFALTGFDAQGARLFYVLYFVGTGLHGLHMLAGLGLVGVLMLRARSGALAPPRLGAAPWSTPVEVTGLYWSFVDMVWLVLYPLIYVIGRTQ